MFVFPVKLYPLVCDISSFPDSEVSMVSGLSSLSLFNNLLYPGINGNKAVGFIYLCFFGTLSGKDDMSHTSKDDFTEKRNDKTNYRSWWIVQGGNIKN